MAFALLVGHVGCSATDDHDAAAGATMAAPFPRPDAGAKTLYPQVEAILTKSCALERCHRGQVFGGGLLFPRGGDLHAALVGVPACEYERFALVEPGDPESSWLMVKLTAPFRGAMDPYANYIHFDPPADWNPNNRRCPDETDTGEPLFGQRMPATAPNMLAEADLHTISEWIAQGAPR